MSPLPPGPLLVTGGTGFVGGTLVPMLRERFPEREVVVAAPGNTAAHGAAVLPLDLLDTAEIDRVVAAVRPAALVQLAALSHVQEAQGSGDLVWRVNTLGVAALVDAVLRHAPACRVLHVSSGEVYGLTANTTPSLAETAPLAPANRYAASKAAAEIALREAALRGLRCVIARPFNHTGPAQETRFVVPRIVSQVARIAAGRQEPILRLGALDRARDFLHVRDVCDAYCTILDQFDRAAAAGIVNIASGTARTIGAVVEDVVRRAGVTCEIVAEPSALRPTDVLRLCGDAGLARSLLGWAPATAWDALLDEMLTAHLAAARAA